MFQCNSINIYCYDPISCTWNTYIICVMVILSNIKILLSKCLVNFTMASFKIHDFLSTLDTLQYSEHEIYLQYSIQVIAVIIYLGCNSIRFSWLCNISNVNTGEVFRYIWRASQMSFREAVNSWMVCLWWWICSAFCVRKSVMSPHHRCGDVIEFLTQSLPQHK